MTTFKKLQIWISRMKNLEALEKMDQHYKLLTIEQSQVIAAAFRWPWAFQSTWIPPTLWWVSEYTFSFTYSESARRHRKEETLSVLAWVGIWVKLYKEKVRRIQCRLEGLGKISERKRQYNFGFQDRTICLLSLFYVTFLLK